MHILKAAGCVSETKEKVYKEKKERKNMNPFKSNNVVAQIIQVYAYLNAIGGAISALSIKDDVGGTIAFIWFAIVLVVSFLLYAFGEVIDLLHEIKQNTGKKENTVLPDELPQL